MNREEESPKDFLDDDFISNPINILSPEYLGYNEFIKIAEKEQNLIALAGKSKVKHTWSQYKKRKEFGEPPKVHKAPQINWDENPSKYKGMGDKYFGMAIRCTYYPSIKKHFVVIDLDLPKKDRDDHIPIESLVNAFIDIQKLTHCRITPSGGLHIYLLSKARPKAKQPKINIDYQANKSPDENRGKYIVGNWRWNLEGTGKEHYKHLPVSHDDILIVDNADLILKHMLNRLEEMGLLISEEQLKVIEIINLLKPFVREVERNKYACAIAGYFYKEGYTQEITEEIIKGVFEGDEELYSNRLGLVARTYQEKDKRNIKGWSYLKQYLSPQVAEDLQKSIGGKGANLKSKILQKLMKNTEPTAKLLADYVNQELDLYKNLNTLKYYERTPEGGFHEINEDRVIEFCNEEFGIHAISSKRCNQVLNFVTHPIKKDYNILEFTNGVLNTETREFIEDKTFFDVTPKMSLPFRWNPEAEGNKIEEVINQILDNSNYPEDKDLWFRAVGHALLGVNRIGKLVIVTGPTKTGKSTLTTILKRIFNYSSIPVITITKNERFTLYPMIDKDINIDDDINNGVLKNIGNLNTVAMGNGLEVEVKGENKSIKAENKEIPRLFANGNTLPPVLGEGFDSRLLLIHAENQIPHDQRLETLQSDILNGMYDHDLEWFVYTAVNKYLDKIDEPLTTEDMEAKMKEDQEFRSYPLSKAIDMIFNEDIVNEPVLKVKEVYQAIKLWCKWAYKTGKISKEHLKPSTRAMTRAMDHAGYLKKKVRVDESDYEWYYEDIEFSKHWKDLQKDIIMILGEPNDKKRP